MNGEMRLRFGSAAGAADDDVSFDSVFSAGGLRLEPDHGLVKT